MSNSKHVPGICYLPYGDTGYFSKLVIDYLNAAANILPFFTYAPSAEGLKEAVAARSRYRIDRQTLISTLTKQYEGLEIHDKVAHNLQLLAQDNAYTVCTAHQPNLLTGYLYFVYKILHAIRLAEELKQQHPDKNFVPVYYMGSEDNDLDELGTFRYNGNKYVWDGDGQSGAVGRMKTASLKALLNNVMQLLGPPGKDTETLKRLITNAYLQHDTIGAATHYLVNELFGRYGLVILNSDDDAFKRAIIPIMEDDLLHQVAHPIVTAQIEKLSAHYKAQASPRPINLFYLHDNLRERIEIAGNEWQVVNTDIRWNKESLLKELHAHPERFSPNVILRGLFQESILPNVAFIGGGAEVAYWLQLKPLFEHYKIFYPTILLRQSVLWVEQKEAVLRKKLGLSVPDIFKPEPELLNEYVMTHTDSHWQTTQEIAATESIFTSIKEKATILDPTLKASSEAAFIKVKRQLQILEKKMLRAEKRKMQTQLANVSKLKHLLFPGNSLQERVANFIDYYPLYGQAFFDTLKDAIQPLQSQFLVIENDAV